MPDNTETIKKLIGSLATIQSLEGMGGDPKIWVDNFRKYEPGHYEYAKAQGNRMWEVANYYDRAKIYYEWGISAGDDAYTQKGHELAVNYRDYYAPTGGVSSHWSMPKGVFLHWLTTGDEVSKAWCINVASGMSSGYMYSQLGDVNGEMDNRIQARVIEAQVIAYLITGDELWANKLREALPLILQTQSPDGAYRFKHIQNNDNKPFMVGLLHDAFLLYQRAFEEDVRLEPAMEKANEYMWSENWIEPAQGFQYSPGEEDGDGPAADLNNLIINGFTACGTPEQVEEIFEGSLTSWLEGDKQFNQAYTQACQTLAKLPGAISAWEDSVEPPEPSPEPEPGEPDVPGAKQALERAQVALKAAQGAVRRALRRLG